ncbi:hypothetical protein J1605_018473 [Eschrichtius robustus]|uniref:C2H2-type domain-containing protein n=1 Tax=Eschrichtius robustus TaxID=9764 RepID=A0AB34HVL2_ESCRO|nr:hypothetical protein J1605_018473 [Eschrichtius robustus]
MRVVPDLSEKTALILTEEGGGGGDGGGTVAAKNPWGREKKRMLESGLPLSSPLTMMTTIRESWTCSLTFYSKAEMRIHSRSHTLRPSPTSAHTVAALRQQLLPGPAHAYPLRGQAQRCNFCEKSFRQLSHSSRTPASTPGHAGVHSQAVRTPPHSSNPQSHRPRRNKGKPCQDHSCHRARCDTTSLETPLSTHTVKQGVHLRRLQPGLHAGTTPDATHDAQTYPSRSPAAVAQAQALTLNTILC